MKITTVLMEVTYRWMSEEHPRYLKQTLENEHEYIFEPYKT